MPNWNDTYDCLQVCPVREMVDWLTQHGYPALPVAPKQDPFKYPKKNKNGEIEYEDDGFTPKPLFTGKNPSFLGSNGKPYPVSHHKYQDKLPTEEEIEKWFHNPLTGVGTLGGWNDTVWVDLDAKQFGSQEECSNEFLKILDKIPELKNTFLEQTHSGGYRIAVKTENTGFTNFCLEENGKHVGEALGKGRFTVLSPTLGVSGKPYKNINLAIPVTVESLESIGIYPVKKTNSKPKSIGDKKIKPSQRVTPQRSAGTSVSLENLTTEDNRAILNGECNSNDRSATLAKLLNDLKGWENWCNENNIPCDDDYLELAHKAGGALMIDEDRVDRILDSIYPNARPSAEAAGGEIACWKKIKKLDREIFEQRCSKEMKDNILEEFKKYSSGKKVKNEVDSDNCIVKTTPEETILISLFEDGKGEWTVMADAYYKYSGKGYWQHVTDKIVEKLIAQKSRRLYDLIKKEDDDVKVYRYATDRNKSSSFKFCRSALTEDTASINNTHLISFNNCTVDVRTGEVLNHDKSNLLTSAIACDYVKNAECPEVFKKFVTDVFGEEMLPLIRALTSMLLDPSAPYGYFPHVIGASGSGKGTLLRFWGSMFGLENMRSLSGFADISTPENRHQFLTGARFISFPDLGGWQKDLRSFYELTDNGSMAGRALFSSSAYEKRWYCRFAVASVDYLTIENAGDGWERRCIPLPTNIRKNSVNTNLGKELEDVRADVISWALSMPKDERNDLIINSAQNKKIAEIKREQAIFSDSVKTFIDFTLRPNTSKNKTIENHHLHDWYVAFCKTHGFNPMSITKFLSHFKNVLPQNHVPRKQYRENGKVTSISAHWKNIDLISTSVMEKSGSFSNPEWICAKELCRAGGLEEFEEFWKGVTAVTDTTSSSCDIAVTARTETEEAFQQVSQASQASQIESGLAKKIEAKIEYPPQGHVEFHDDDNGKMVKSSCDACDTPQNPVTASVTGTSEVSVTHPVTAVTPVTPCDVPPNKDVVAAALEELLESNSATWEQVKVVLAGFYYIDMEGIITLSSWLKLKALVPAKEQLISF